MAGWEILPLPIAPLDSFKSLCIWCYKITGGFKKGEEWGLDFAKGIFIPKAKDYKEIPGAPKYELTTLQSGETVVYKKIDADANEITVCFIAKCGENPQGTVSLEAKQIRDTGGGAVDHDVDWKPIPVDGAEDDTKKNKKQLITPM
jgi:hypothetical protein